MKVLVAESCGFCLGVRNAIKMAQETIESRDDVYSLGDIIHNTDVVEKLAAAGLKSAKNLDEINSGTVLIRSHGATDAQRQIIKEKGLDIVDATCVLVKKVQKIAKQLHEDGYKVVIIGDKGHPEVQAIVGSAHDVLVVGDKNDISHLPARSRLGIICQTTQSPEHFAEVLEVIAKTDFTELKVVNTLCNEARKRQNYAIELCQKADIMFVLGGLHSANTKKLAELCKSHNSKTFHLQNWKELDINVLFGCSTAGVTAGASTPQWVIDEFIEKLQAFEA